MLAQQKIKESTILYIEDDAVTRKQLSKFLSSECDTLHTATNGEEGLALYKEFEPDIVITDIEMPKLNGLELATKIRAHSLSTQIIIITAYKNPEYLLAAVNLQLVQYLVKPISLAKITDVLKFASNFLVDEKPETKKNISKNMYYDTYTKELVGKGKIINLSKYERALIELLIKKHPAPISYDYIDAQIYDYSASKNAIKLLVSSLRDKINKQSIVNITGYGYKLMLMDDK